MSYGKYESVLQEEFGVDLAQMIGCLGHPGGVYGDTVLMLSRLVSHPQVNHVLEIGSGLSTIALSHVCAVHGKDLITIEDHVGWAEVANKAVKSWGVDFEVVSNDARKANTPDFGDLQFDVAWIDGTVFGSVPEERPEEGPNFMGRIGGCNYYASNLQEAVLIFDDAQAPGIKDKLEGLQGFYPEFSLDKIVWFSPTDRTDRHQAIFFPQSKDYLREVVEEVAHL